MFSLWNSPEMHRMRMAAWTFLEEHNPEAGKVIWLGQYRGAQQEEERMQDASIWSVLHCVGSLDALIAEKLVHEELIWRLLGAELGQWANWCLRIDVRSSEHDICPTRT